MRYSCAGLLAVCALSTALVAQDDRCGFKYDQSKRLTAYQLTPEQEALFQTNDGNQLSPFWYVWDEIAAMDKAILNCVENYAYGPEDCRENTADAQLTLKAAYGDKGVYLYFEILDDNFMTMPPGQEQYGHFYDACELYIDRYSASDLYSDLSKFLNPTFSQLSLTTNQYQIPFGAIGENPVAFDMVLPWTPMDEWRTWQNDWMYRFDDLSFVDAATNYCIHADVLNGVAGCRRQEWMVPWRMWGAGYANGTIAEGYGSKPPEGTALALTFGYNDMDPTSEATPRASAIRWRNQRDPWLSQNQCPDPNQSVDTWGEILFGASLSSIIAAANKDALDGTPESIAKYYTADRVTVDEDANQTYDRDETKVPVCATIGVRYPRRPLNSGARSFATTTTEFYSITGRKLSSVHDARGGLVLRRDRGAGGKTVASKLITAW